MKIRRHYSLQAMARILKSKALKVSQYAITSDGVQWKSSREQDISDLINSHKLIGGTLQ